MNCPAAPTRIVSGPGGRYDGSMGFGFEIVVVLLLTGLNGLFAMGELALVSARRARLAVLERKGVPGAGKARELAEDPQLFLPTVQVGITLVSVVAGVFGGARISAKLASALEEIPSLKPFAEEIALGLVVVVTTYLTLVVGELVPKQLALRHPEGIAAAIARPLNVLARVMRPFVWLLGRSSDLLLRLFGKPNEERETVTEEELRAMLAEGAEEGVLETEERDMIERLLRLADKPVRAIMTPRNELDWIDRTDTAEEIVQTLRASRHSRFVVCDGAVDNPVGVVLAKDLLDRMLDGGGLQVAAHLEQPQVMPDTVTALDALEQLKGDRLGLALVLDEYGSFEGVVTAADVLAAITGEAQAAEAPNKGSAAAQDGPLVLEGSQPVDELKARLDLPDLPAEGSYHTVGGLLLALLRRVPREGDRIVFGGWRFQVEAMEGRRVARVTAEREQSEEATAQPPAQPA